MRYFLLGPFSSPFLPVRVRHGWPRAQRVPPSAHSPSGAGQGQRSREVLSLLGERGQCILSTPPKILFCDLRLDPGESKSCESCLLLPLLQGSHLGGPLRSECCQQPALLLAGGEGCEVSAKEHSQNLFSTHCKVSLSSAPGPCPLAQLRGVAARHEVFRNTCLQLHAPAFPCLYFFRCTGACLELRLAPSAGVCFLLRPGMSWGLLSSACSGFPVLSARKVSTSHRPWLAALCASQPLSVLPVGPL